MSENRKLDNLRDEQIKGILLRSKAEWIEGSEKNTAFLCKFRKKRVSEKNVKLLRNKDGKLMKNNRDSIPKVHTFTQISTKQIQILHTITLCLIL